MVQDNVHSWLPQNRGGRIASTNSLCGSVDVETLDFHFQNALLLHHPCLLVPWQGADEKEGRGEGRARPRCTSREGTRAACASFVAVSVACMGGKETAKGKAQACWQEAADEGNLTGEQERSKQSPAGWPYAWREGYRLLYYPLHFLQS